MFRSRLYILALALTILTQGCNPLAGGFASGAGMCKVSDTSTINTYDVFGSWKKISGYPTARTDAELELNYDVLLVPNGTPFCVVEVVNRAQGNMLDQGTYVQDITAKTIDFTYIAPSELSGTQNAHFTFSGSCDKTVMTLQYDNGSVEKYQVLSKDAASISCSAPASQ